jgi:hypothetical protein
MANMGLLTSTRRLFFLFIVMLIYICDLSDLSRLASHILLKGIPTTATSGDVRRAVMLAGLQGVTKGELACKTNHF